MDSIIDPSYKSFLTTKQENLIPEVPVVLQQNKKLVSIWFEAKSDLEEWFKKQTLMTSQEQEEGTNMIEIQTFLQNTLTSSDMQRTFWRKICYWNFFFDSFTAITNMP